MSWLASGWVNYAELLVFCWAAGVLSGDVFPARDRVRRQHVSHHLCRWCLTEWTAPRRISRCPACRPWMWG